MRKIRRSRYGEYIGCAERCTANRVYPLSVATLAQDGEIFEGKDCVLFWHYCGFAYISGNAGADDLEEIYQRFLVPDTKRRFILITDSESVADHYSDRQPLRLDKRIEYTYDRIPDDPPALDDNYAVERIGADNTVYIQGNITPYFSWKDSDAFLRSGFGYMARNKEDGSFAAVAFSSAVSSEEIDIGVETYEAHRHHGLASYLAYEMCSEIIKQGKRPVWAHAQTNEGSRKTALGVGFEPRRINTVIHKKQ